jgi:hypothetical protein
VKKPGFLSHHGLVQLGYPKPGSAVRYNQDFGDMLITADDTCINFTFSNRPDEMIDSYTLTR